MDEFEIEQLSKDPAKSLSSSIAMRIAYSVFVGQNEEPWFLFRERWEQATCDCDPRYITEHVLTKISAILKNRRILIIADELVQTGVERKVRNTLYGTLRRASKGGRMIVSSLSPRQLPGEVTAVPTTWVQLRRHSPNDISQVVDSCEWIRDSKDSETRYHALYSFSIPSTNWRAIEHLFVKYNEDCPSGPNCLTLTLTITLTITMTIIGYDSTIESLSSAQQTVRSTLKTIVHLFEFVHNHLWLDAVNVFLVHTVLGHRVDLREYSKKMFVNSNAVFWVHNGLLANSVPVGSANIPEFDVPEISLVIIHKWLESENHQHKNDLVPLVAKLWEYSQISVQPQSGKY